MKGYLPNRLNISLETDKTGKTKLLFREWHDFTTDEEFQFISEQTQATANAMLQRYAHLKMDVEFKAYPEEKSFEVIYVGKDVRPGINAIFFELMPQLVRNKDDAFKIADLLMQAIKMVVSLQIIRPSDNRA